MPGGGGNAYRVVLGSFSGARCDGHGCFAPGRNQVTDVQTGRYVSGLIDKLNPRAWPRRRIILVLRQECDNQIPGRNVCRQGDRAVGAVTCGLRRLRTYNSWKGRLCFLNPYREIKDLGTTGKKQACEQNEE